MSIAKTRQKLIEVARDLFAHNGLEATTMNDIAQASGKGRRTLYTYFRNKEEIYKAVVEEELERLSERMELVAAQDAAPERKILTLIYAHLNAMRETVARNGSLRAEFFRNGNTGLSEKSLSSPLFLPLYRLREKSGENLSPRRPFNFFRQSRKRVSRRCRVLFRSISYIFCRFRTGRDRFFRPSPPRF